MSKPNHEGLWYYHCTVYTTSGSKFGWVGWAQSGEDAEGKAMADYTEKGLSIAGADVEGHE